MPCAPSSGLAVTALFWVQTPVVRSLGQPCRTAFRSEAHRPPWQGERLGAGAFLGVSQTPLATICPQTGDGGRCGGTKFVLDVIAGLLATAFGAEIKTRDLTSMRLYAAHKTDHVT